jgi:hypothetical protein
MDSDGLARIIELSRHYTRLEADDRVPSVSGRGAVRDPQEARGSSQDLPPKGHDFLEGGVTSWRSGMEGRAILRASRLRRACRSARQF